MLKVNFLSVLNNFPLLNFTVSPGEENCFTDFFCGCYNTAQEQKTHPKNSKV